MSVEQTAPEKKRGKPAKGAECLPLMLEPCVLQAIDAWSSHQTGVRPSRAEAARMLLVERLRAAGYLKE
jgi:hypothetical protein